MPATVANPLALNFSDDDFVEIGTTASPASVLRAVGVIRHPGGETHFHIEAIAVLPGYDRVANGTYLTAEDPAWQERLRALSSGWGTPLPELVHMGDRQYVLLITPFDHS